jgi:hypothetical protein
VSSHDNGDKHGQRISRRDDQRKFESSCQRLKENRRLILSGIFNNFIAQALSLSGGELTSRTRSRHG